MTTLQCPYCGSYNVKKTVKGKIKENAAAFGAGAALGIVKESINSVSYGIGGRFIPSSLADKAVEWVPVNHECLNCDCLFTAKCTSEGEVKSVSLSKMPMPESIINAVKSQYIFKLHKERPYISAVIFGLLTLYFLFTTFYSFTIESFWVSGFSIICCGTFTIAFLIPTIMKVSKIKRNNNEIELCEFQSPREFKITHRHLFYNYPQYN